jgi:hypothetical protein
MSKKAVRMKNKNEDEMTSNSDLSLMLLAMIRTYQKMHGRINNTISITIRSQ